MVDIRNATIMAKGLNTPNTASAGKAIIIPIGIIKVIRLRIGS
jgi:hypothetical protein